MKKVIQALLRRIFGPLFFGAALLALPGCAATYRTVGMQDPAVEMVRALAATQTSTIKALTDALTAAQKSACPVEGGR